MASFVLRCDARIPWVIGKPSDKLFSISLVFRLVTPVSFQHRVSFKYGICVWLVVYMQLLLSLCTDAVRLLCMYMFSFLKKTLQVLSV